MISAIQSQSSMLELMNKMREVSAQEITPTAIQPSDQADLSVDFSNVLHSINHDQNMASKLMHAVDTGQSDDVVGAMVASQKADLSFSMLIQVRNKVMSGVDDVMRMSL